MISVDRLISRSVERMGAVDPHVKALAIELIRRAYAEGICVQITSGYRSPEEQDALYAKGRTAPGQIVTNAKAGQSVHNYGLAIDFVLLSSDGSKAIWTVNKDWRRVAEIGKELGFTWGGDWKSFKDYAHLEYTQGHTWVDLKNGWRPSFDGKPVPEPKKPTKDEGKESVKEYQKLLNKHGYNLVVDGIHGPLTDKAVRDFQKKHGLKVDGVVGPQTLAELKKDPKPTAKPTQKASIVPYPGHVIKRGSTDTQNIKRIQRAVGVKVDGKFGPATERAVKAYQSRHGLKVDGVVGPETWAEMF